MDLRLLNGFKEALHGRIHNNIKHDQLPKWLKNCASFQEIEDYAVDNLVEKLVDMAMKTSE